jgi:hypothetical protein
MKKVLAILSILCLLAACREPDLSEEFSAGDDLRLEIKGYTVFLYNPLTCQRGFDRSSNEFRIHTDNMSDFFIVRLDSIPVSEGETTAGTVSWTTGDDLHNKKTSFEAIKLEGGKIWLWSSSHRIAAVVEILE